MKPDDKSTQIDVISVFAADPEFAVPETVVTTPDELVYCTLHAVPVATT